MHQASRKAHLQGWDSLGRSSPRLRDAGPTQEGVPRADADGSALPSQVCLPARQSFPELRTRPRRFPQLGETDLESEEGTQGTANPRCRSSNVWFQDRKSGNAVPTQNPPIRAPKQRRSPLERWRTVRSWRIEAKRKVDNRRGRKRKVRTRRLVVQKPKPSARMENPSWEDLHRFL